MDYFCNVFINCSKHQSLGEMSIQWMDRNLSDFNNKKQTKKNNPNWS